MFGYCGLTAREVSRGVQGGVQLAGKPPFLRTDPAKCSHKKLFDYNELRA